MSISRSGTTEIGQFYSIIQKKGIQEKYSIYHTRSTFSAPEKSTIHGKEGSVRLFTIKLFPHYILATTSKTQIMQTHLMWSLIKIWFVIPFFFSQTSFSTKWNVHFNHYVLLLSLGNWWHHLCYVVCEASGTININNWETSHLDMKLCRNTVVHQFSRDEFSILLSEVHINELMFGVSRTQV